MQMVSLANPGAPKPLRKDQPRFELLLHAAFFKASNFPVSTECMNWSPFKGRNKTMKDRWSLRQSWMGLTGKVDEASPQHCNKHLSQDPGHCCFLLRCRQAGSCLIQQ